MSKTSIEPQRHALSGPTMGSRWTALFFAAAGFNAAPVQRALQAAVDRVDTQMSTWRDDSDLMRLNAAPVGEWREVPPELAEVLALGAAIGRASGGAFDMGQGTAVRAWGFGPAPADPGAILAALERSKLPAHDALDLEPGRVRKTAPVTLDLNGIAKGYGVDRLAQVLTDHGIDAGLVGIEGEMRALGLRPDGRPWAVAIEAPDPDRRAPLSMLALQDAAVATSGDYRHFVTLRGQRLSHTMDPACGGPLQGAPASVTVVAQTCARADAWATALMVAGPRAGVAMAQAQGLDALILTRDAGGAITRHPAGRLFASDGA